MTAPTAAGDGTPPNKSLGDRWVAFLRGYGPINRMEGMFAETLPRHARRFGFQPLQFEHPYLGTLLEALNPAEGQLTNVILTGTAGDGKTSLCHELWARFGGSADRQSGKNRQNYLPLDVETPNGKRTLHFIFEFSGWCPEKGQPWSEAQLALINLFARSVQESDPEDYFIIAANDGRLVQAFDSLPREAPGKALAKIIEELLAAERSTLNDLNLLFLNLSRMSTAEILDRAIDCLVGRPEWSCLDDQKDDPAFSPSSPLVRNFRLLNEPLMRSRLHALGELLDSNDLHVSIREILLLLVNALLGWKEGQEALATADDLRSLTETGRVHEAAIYGNLFGANLSERRRDKYAVFRFLGGFRIGHETTNLLDNLLIFGPFDEAFVADFKQYLASDPYYADDPVFEQLRIAYLEAEDERSDGARDFLEALVNERRRLFFRLPEKDERLDPWKLSIFPSAGEYRRQVLEPLRAGPTVDTIILQRVVCGLNRIWTGMLAGSLDRLYLSTGLDFSSAKICDIFLDELPLRRGLHGAEIAIVAVAKAPVLRVRLGRDEPPVDFPLWLVRYEFLSRVAQGALPSSFSKECNEDVLAFKSQVLSQYFKRGGTDLGTLSVLSAGPRGTLVTHQLGISL